GGGGADTAAAVTRTDAALNADHCARIYALALRRLKRGPAFFTSSDKGSSFGSYNLGGALTYHVNRFVGIEGEVGGTLGTAQNLPFGSLQQDEDGAARRLPLRFGSR
ncbi:MAG TPA: hypothetical protein VHT95_05270, partial [Vicinamibacterales bacterium]|nr:hypothetical protein [Vicinamibacterales bacterium]